MSALADLKFEAEWQLAATVVAWTYVGTNQHDAAGSTLTQHSIRSFAEIGIRGLKSKDTIRAYRAAWEAAGGDMNIHPG